VFEVALVASVAEELVVLVVEEEVTLVAKKLFFPNERGVIFLV